MNYLETNLHNSYIFSYDIMKIIYEYADPFNQVRKQIQNKEYDLDEIMYQRMKKEILTKFNSHYIISSFKNQSIHTFITSNNIHNKKHKNLLVNGCQGYKDFFLWRHKRHTRICGFQPEFKKHYTKYQMIEDLKIMKKNIIYEILSIEEIYQLWKNL